MKTKSLVRFLNRAAHFNADIELLDVFYAANNRNILAQNDRSKIFDDVNTDKHPTLSARPRTPKGRKSAIIHLKATVYSSFIKDLYEDLTIYFREILNHAANNKIDPNRLIGSCSIQIDAKSILECGGWNEITTMITDKIFRQLENKKDTKKLIEEMNNKLGLLIQQDTIESALPYFELRHLLVHADGVADKKFCDSFPNFGAIVGEKIKLDYTLITNARNAVKSLIIAFDNAVVSKSIVARNELQP